MNSEALNTTGIATPLPCLRNTLFRRVALQGHFLGLLVLSWMSLTLRSEESNSHTNYWGGLYQYRSATPSSYRYYRPVALDTVRKWNEIAINASGLDHTPVLPGEPRVFGEQLGPGRSSRAMAIVHIAMFDTINAVIHKYDTYTDLEAQRAPVSLDVAVSQAAHDTLASLFPSQAPNFDILLDRCIAPWSGSPLLEASIELGQRAASAILSLRTDDGSEHPEPKVGIDYIPSKLPGQWRQDPVSKNPLALGAYWSECAPFVLKSSSQFRVPPPPALTSKAYLYAYNEVRRMGGDGRTTPTLRKPYQGEIGVFWAYDGTPSLCAPPRLYNQVAVQVADQMGTTDPVELARLLALVNVAMADAGIAIWESKYYYGFWRPVTGIRESDPGTGPTGRGDGNPWTQGDKTFTPVGAPASNLTGPNFTPPFPAYPSGHAGFGGAIFQVLRKFYETDRVSFTFVSDEFNGVTKGNDGVVRPYKPRRFTSFSQAEEENGQSRIYLGIHWSFDKVEGIKQGRNVGNYVFDHLFRPTCERSGYSR